MDALLCFIKERVAFLASIGLRGTVKEITHCLLCSAERGFKQDMKTIENSVAFVVEQLKHSLLRGLYAQKLW